MDDPFEGMEGMFGNMEEMIEKMFEGFGGFGQPGGDGVTRESFSRNLRVTRENGKTKIVPKESLTGRDGWIPICEKGLPFEMTASFLLTADAPGRPGPIKLPEQFAAMFPAGACITEQAGAALADWARGGKPLAAPAPAPGSGAGAGAEASGEQVFVESAASRASDAAILEKVEGWTAVGEEKARAGLKSLREWYEALPAGAARNKFGREILPGLKKIAEEHE
jgi:hypothetical protein